MLTPVFSIFFDVSIRRVINLVFAFIFVVFIAGFDCRTRLVSKEEHGHTA